MRTASSHDLRGVTMLEALAVIALTAALVLIATGMLQSGRRNQKQLLYTARLVATDVRASIETARSRSLRLNLQMTGNGYTIYIEEDAPADGWQEGEEVIIKRSFEKGLKVTGPVSVPESWSDPESIREGDIIELSAKGLVDQHLITFTLPGAPAYQTVCVRLFHSGDSQVLRLTREAKWVEAPLG